jgi:hypothetical protein
MYLPPSNWSAFADIFHSLPQTREKQKGQRTPFLKKKVSVLSPESLPLYKAFPFGGSLVGTLSRAASNKCSFA